MVSMLGSGFRVMGLGLRVRMVKFECLRLLGGGFGSWGTAVSG